MSYQWWHLTCEHAVTPIEQDGFTLKPNPQPMLGRLPLIWFTTSPTAVPTALGLTATILRCDRTEHLYRVIDADVDLVHRWDVLKREPWFEQYLPGARLLESARGTRPMLWGVAVEPVRVVPIR